MNYLLILLSTLFLSTANALETDQFLPGNVILKDSSTVMNAYFHRSIRRALDEGNRKNLSCRDLAYLVMENATGKYSISKASSYASSTPLIERFPDDSVSDRSYIRSSFYQHATLPIQIVKIARTINVGGIYVGTDKFGHFTHIGKSYYKKYLNFKKIGLTEDQSIRKAIVEGFNTEYGSLGLGIWGVLSYGDLEANYQGFMFALDMCKEENPIIIKENQQWIENPEHQFDVKNYFNPKMDESFHLSFWKKSLYQKIENKLKSEYCEVKHSPIYVERFSFYREIVKENLNDVLIKENILNQKRFDPKFESLEGACP